MRWTYDKEGIVNIKQSRGQYDRYASKTFVLTAVSEGNVEVTGTPLIAKEGVKPVTFTVTVTESSKEPPDSDNLVKWGINSCESYYNRWKSDHEKYSYNDEWDIIALKRAGFSLSKDDEAAITYLQREHKRRNRKGQQRQITRRRKTDGFSE